MKFKWLQYFIMVVIGIGAVSGLGLWAADKGDPMFWGDQDTMTIIQRGGAPPAPASGRFNIYGTTVGLFLQNSAGTSFPIVSPSGINCLVRPYHVDCYGAVSLGNATTNTAAFQAAIDAAQAAMIGITGVPVVEIGPGDYAINGQLSARSAPWICHGGLNIGTTIRWNGSAGATVIVRSGTDPGQNAFWSLEGCAFENGTAKPATWLNLTAGNEVDAGFRMSNMQFTSTTGDAIVAGGWYNLWWQNLRFDDISGYDVRFTPASSQNLSSFHLSGFTSDDVGTTNKPGYFMFDNSTAQSSNLGMVKISDARIETNVALAGPKSIVTLKAPTSGPQAGNAGLTLLLDNLNIQGQGQVDDTLIYCDGTDVMFMAQFTNLMIQGISWDVNGDCHDGILAKRQPMGDRYIIQQRFDHPNALSLINDANPWLTLINDSSDPLSPPTGMLRIYSKSTGLFTKDAAGNVDGPLGTGGGGGSGTGITTVRVATTANITLSGPQTIDGVANIGANSELVLVKDQSDPTVNGIWVSHPTVGWSRSTSFNDSAEFVAGFPVYVQSGTLNGGTVWNFSTVGTFTINSTAVTFTRTGPGPAGELLANKSTVSAAAANGYVGADSAGNVAYNRIGSFAQHLALSNASQITVTARQMGIECSSGTCDLTSSPQIVAGVANQEVTLIGTHASQTVKLDHGTGIRLCGNMGSVVLGLNTAKVSFRYNSTLTVWEQLDCQGLPSAWAVDNVIVADETRPLKICNAAGTSCKSMYVDSGSSNPQEINTCSGVTCANTTVGPLPTSGKFRVLNNSSAEIFVVNENGTISGLTIQPRQWMSALNWLNTSCPFTDYVSPMGNATHGTEGRAQQVVTQSMTIQKLRVKLTATVPSGETYTFTVRKNGASTALACSIIQGGSTGTGEIDDSACTDSSDSFSVVAGDLLATQIVCSGGSAANIYGSIAMEAQ